MSDNVDLNGVRSETLRRIEKSERNLKLALIVAAVVELLFLVGYVLLADFGDRTHVLLLIATIAAYTIIITGLHALGSHVERSTLRVLKALELLDERLAE